MPIYIEQYTSILEDAKGNEAQIPSKPLGAEPTLQVAVGSSSARTATNLDSSTRFVILTADVDCQFEVGGSTVTADANSRPLWANTYREVEIGNSDTDIAVIEKQ